MNQGKRAPRWLGLCLCCLPFLSTGCQGKDPDRLAELGERLKQKIEALLRSPGGKKMRGLSTVPLQLAEPSIEARVIARLKWDRELSDTPIDVKATGSVIELAGKVGGAEQRRRAVELAQTTQGVDKVVDRLE